ncbi:bifunctional metallophosphatase/5'-nucleotidase [Halosegnis longus]|uniref:Bifunctional metallophosphatase/5'-nucleotidase n=1 Tax=Halosegnis longus TaxID=2216012 RepID=A0AAJ4R9G8_9EURY|nr:5'-nucleotidase C-terminal domain-containing protein [Halosegnis longus]RNJ26764.1 bifunctional metallophosphatase/5'-nucleotidase [Salella cibi]
MLRLLHYSDIENAYDDPARLARLAGTIDARRDADTLVFGTGDNTSPGVLPLVTKGEQALDFFHAVDPDADTFGNHDFDYGPDRALDIIERAPQPWLCANVKRDGEQFGHESGVRPWQIFERDGKRVGVFGLVTPKTASINPATEDVVFTDPIAAAEEAVADLRAKGVDYVVCLSHLGRGDETLAAEVDVDVVLGGHNHAELVERLDDTLLTRPGVNGQVLFEVTLPEKAVTRHVVADGPRDETIAEAVETRLDEAGVDEVVATVEEPIERTEVACFHGESRVGNFVADAYRWETDADVGLQNSGGIRSGPALSGEVTVGDLISLIPFDEPLAVAELTGAELREVFRQGEGSRLGFGEPDWWHAHLSGATIEYDRASDTLTSATVNGEPLDPDRTYRVALADYLLHSDDEFPAVGMDHRVETTRTQYEVLADYARSEGLDPTVEGRVRHV